jgi:hypothetical protein
MCEQNIAHFQKLLEQTTDPVLRRTLEGLLKSARRELALLESKLSGAEGSPLEARRRRQGDAQTIRLQFQPDFEASVHPYMLLDPAPGSRAAHRRHQRRLCARDDDGAERRRRPLAVRNLSGQSR